MKAKHWIRFGAFALLAIAIIYFLSVFLQIPSARDNVGMYGFRKEPKNSIDVGMIGGSDIYTSFYSPLAYEEYGFTSYAMSTSGFPGVCAKSAVRELLTTQKPQLLVVELYIFQYSKKNMGDEARLRKWIDNISTVQNRNETIAEVVPEERQKTYYQSFLKYHSNWQAIGECIRAMQNRNDIDRKGYSLTKNFACWTRISKYKDNTSEYFFDEEGLVELESFIDYAHEMGFEDILFIRSAAMDEYITDASYDRALEILEEKDCDFLDIYAQQDEIGIDKKRDFHNEWHLNIFGVEKATNFLGKYIAENYDLDLNHSPEVKAEWDDCASYNEYIISGLKYRTEHGTLHYDYTQSDFLR